MTASFYIDAARDLLVGRVSGLVRPEEIVESMGAAVAQSKGAALQKNVLFIVDAGAQLHLMDGIALAQVRQAVGTWVKAQYPARNVRTALVSSDDRAGPMMKLWQATADLHLEIGSTVRTFKTEAEAVSWLGARRQGR